MTGLTHDSDSRVAAGVGFAVLSATSFGLSGALARGLMDAGWTSGAAVATRILIAAAVLAPAAVVQLRGRWRILRANLSTVLVYGVIAVAGCQLAYFNAVAHMQVGAALLIEYIAPVAVIGWLWLRHGQRPGRLTVVGGLVALVGLVLVLDLVSGAQVSVVGILWGLAAMASVTFYFVISSDESSGLPGTVLATGGLLIGGAALVVAGVVGVVPMATSDRDVVFRSVTAPWWVPILALGVVTAALAYVTGIAATRRLGSRLASFVALGEVLAALVFAWLLLGEVPGVVQAVGGVLILAGVVTVKLGEGRTAGKVGVEPLVTATGRPAVAGTPR